MAKSSTCFSMHVTDNIAVANVIAKPLDTERLSVAVFLAQCSLFVAVYDRKDGRCRGNTNGCRLHGHGEGKYYSCCAGLTPA